MNCRLTIIVPVYNVEAYVAKCLDSLLNQDIDRSSYEILVINDGATDGSLPIVQGFLEKFKNIHILSQDNKGLGAARNLGIQNAKGTYLLFVDADDYLEPNCLKWLLNRADKDKLEILRFQYKSITPNGQIIAPKKTTDQRISLINEVVNGPYFLAHHLGWTCYIPLFLFKKAFIHQENLWFKEGVYFEDAEWLPRALIRSRRVSTDSQVVYYYVRRAGSITKPLDPDKKEKLIQDRLLLIRSLLSFNGSVSDQGVTLWVKCFIARTVLGLLSSIRNSSFKQRVRTVNELKQLNIFPLTVESFSYKQKMIVSLVNLNPFLFFFLKRGISTTKELLT